VADGGKVTLTLFDDTEEPLDPSTLSIGPDGVVYAKVKAGRFDARFSRHAQTQLGPLLVKDEPPTVRVGGEERQIPARGHVAEPGDEKSRSKPTARN
jgi:hypothetical protein